MTKSVIPRTGHELRRTINLKEKNNHSFTDSITKTETMLRDNSNAEYSFAFHSTLCMNLRSSLIEEIKLLKQKFQKAGEKEF